MSARNDLKKELRRMGYPLRTAEVLTQEPTGFELYLAAKFMPQTGHPDGILARIAREQALERVADLLIDGAAEFRS